MASTFSLEHEFLDISLEKFEKYLNDDKLNQMLEKSLGFKERKLIETDKSTNGEIVWVFSVKKQGQIPSALSKFIPDGAIAWQEKSRFVPGEHCVYWEITPKMSGLKFHGEGTWQLYKEKKGCRRVIEGKVSVEIPFVGKMVESLIVGELKKTYELEPDVQKDFYSSVS